MRSKNYRPVKGQSYTRKEFVKGFPAPKITKFTMGDTKTEFEYEGRLIALEKSSDPSQFFRGSACCDEPCFDGEAC